MIIYGDSDPFKRRARRCKVRLTAEILHVLLLYFFVLFLSAVLQDLFDLTNEIMECVTHTSVSSWHLLFILIGEN